MARRLVYTPVSTSKKTTSSSSNTTYVPPTPSVNQTPTQNLTDDRYNQLLAKIVALETKMESFVSCRCENRNDPDESNESLIYHLQISGNDDVIPFENEFFSFVQYNRAPAPYNENGDILPAAKGFRIVPKPGVEFGHVSPGGADKWWFADRTLESCNRAQSPNAYFIHDDDWLWHMTSETQDNPYFNVDGQAQPDPLWYYVVEARVTDSHFNVKLYEFAFIVGKATL